MKNIVLALCLLFLLTGCSTGNAKDVEVYIDHEGRQYETIMIGETLWMKEDLQVLTNNKGEAMSIHLIEGYDTVHYDLSVLQHLDAIVSEGWRLPTNNEWDKLLATYPTLDSLTEDDGINLSLSGMYDFTGVHQWTGLGCLYISINEEDSTFAYYFNDGSKIALERGSFHPDDGFSIRLVKSKD